MQKQEYRQVLEMLYEKSNNAREIFNRFTAIIPRLNDALLVQKISFYIHELIEMPDEPSIEITVKMILHMERANHAKSDLEEYLLLKIKEKAISWQEEAHQHGWAPVSDLQKENEELRRLLVLSENIRKKYAKGKQDMYAMGGDVAKAAFKCLPHGDRQLESSPLTT